MKMSVARPRSTRPLNGPCVAILHRDCCSGFTTVAASRRANLRVFTRVFVPLPATGDGFTAAGFPCRPAHGALPTAGFEAILLTGTTDNNHAARKQQTRAAPQR